MTGKQMLAILVGLAVFCLLMVLWLAPMPANAEGIIPRGLGHSAPPTPHWYEGGCCNLQDCEPVEAGAITATPKGYHVRYLTSRGFVADGVIPFGSSSIRPSRDAREHACAKPDRVLCIYLPMTM